MTAADPGLTDLIAAEVKSHTWGHEYENAAHEDHTFDGGCKVCRGDVEAIAARALSVVEQHTNGRTAEENEILRNDVFESENERKGWSTRALTAEATVDRVREFADNAQGWFDSHQQGPVADAVEVLIDYLRAALEGEQQ